MAEMTLEQKKMLEPFGQIFADMDQKIRSMSDEGAKEMLKACYAASATNCWCCTFDAAEFLQRGLRREILDRQRRAEAAAPAQA